MERELVAHADEGTRRSELYEHSYYLVFEIIDSSVAISAFARSLPIWKPMGKEYCYRPNNREHQAPFFIFLAISTG